MPSGMPVSRAWVVMLRDGIPAVDWGGGLFQDILSGEFLRCAEHDVSHTIHDDELELLARAGLVYAYDATTVDLLPLPDQPRRSME